MSILLVWSCLLVLPVGRLVEAPVMLMALAGLYLLVRRWRHFRDDPAIKLLAVVFLLAWIPILVSLVNAVNPENAARICVNHLRFAFSGVFIVYALSTADAHRSFLGLCAWLLLFWLADGIVQIAFGRDLFGFGLPSSSGFEREIERINALFGMHNLVYATLLSVLSPLLWAYAHRNWGRWATLAVVLATIFVILLAGTRSAWVNVFVLVIACMAILAWRAPRLALRTTLMALPLAAVMLTTLWFGSDQFAARVKTGFGSLTGSTNVVLDALGHRFWIARGAWNMFADNPLNGVGAGGFRYAFEEYGDADDPYLHAEPPIVPYHSHNYLLQLLSETGALGAAGIATLLIVLVVAGARAPPDKQRTMVPYGLCLLIAYFPINSHMAIYSSFWSQIVWWLIALYCAAYGAKHPQNAAA